MESRRIVIVGGPRTGKSTLARQLRAEGVPTFCGDPRSKVKDPEPDVTYLPENLGFGSASSQWIVDHWLPMPGPWCLEGHVMARVLRKHIDQHGKPPPLDRLIVRLDPYPEALTLRGQAILCESVRTVWSEIEMWFRDLAEVA